MTNLRRFAYVTLCAPLALALAACGDDAEDGALAGEPVAEVAPPEGSTWAEQVVRTPEGGWLVGNPDAPIHFLEYGSLTCPACANFSMNATEALHAEYIESGRVSFEFRSVPIHGVIDIILTRLLNCAPDTAAIPLADQLWANNAQITGGFQANGPALEQAYNLPPEQRFAAMAQVGGLTDFFSARGISSDQAAVCLSDVDAIQAMSDQLEEQTTADGVTGTPTFFLNGQRLQDTSWQAVEPALQRAGARPAE
jgi:protein-disulfide isomerase